MYNIQTDLCMVFHRVGIGQQATLAIPVCDHKAAAGGAVLPFALPWE